MSTKLNLADVALPQETLTVDDVEYLVTAMPATASLQFMEQYQESIDSGKADLATMKKIICKYVVKDNAVIDDKKFDIIFARKLGHLGKLYQAVLEYNFQDVFGEAGSEE